MPPYDVLRPILEAYVSVMSRRSRSPPIGFDLELVPRCAPGGALGIQGQQAAPVLKVAWKYRSGWDEDPSPSKSRCKLEGGSLSREIASGMSQKPPTLIRYTTQKAGACARITFRKSLRKHELRNSLDPYVFFVSGLARAGCVIVSFQALQSAAQQNVPPAPATPAAEPATPTAPAATAPIIPRLIRQTLPRLRPPRKP